MTASQRGRRTRTAAWLRRLASRIDPQPVGVISLGEPAMMMSVAGQDLLVPVSHPYARYVQQMAMTAANN